MPPKSPGYASRPRPPRSLVRFFLLLGFGWGVLVFGAAYAAIFFTPLWWVFLLVGVALPLLFLLLAERFAPFVAPALPPAWPGPPAMDDMSSRDDAPAGVELPAAARPAATLAEPLSGREREVLLLLAQGKSNSEIASDLFLALGTIKAHTNTLYRKLDARNRTEALARARDLGLLP